MSRTVMRSRSFALLAALLLACSSGSTTTADAGSDAAPPPPALGMNDVSVLVPLPSSPSAPGYLGPTDAGDKGPLLPQTVYDKIPKFGVPPAQGLDYARMRAVAIRFDGCFPGKAGCEAQIRLVMQPITDDGQALDSALHLFYLLTEEELGVLVGELRRLRTLAPEVKDAPLDVHAGLAAQGAEGPYGAALRELVLRFAGKDNLVRMTFFLRAPPREEEWFFGGLERVNGLFQVLDIVGVGPMNQRVNRPLVTEGYQYVFTPAPTTPEDGSLLLTSDGAKAAARPELEKAFASYLRVENPKKYGPDALPCAGCHVSTFVTESARVAFGLDAAAFPNDAFSSKRDLTRRGESGGNPSSLRAFGWFERKPMIGQRVVNETASVVDDLEARFPAKK
jgi:hypothetical protein